MFEKKNLTSTQKEYVPLRDRFKSFPVNRQIQSDQELFLLNKIAGYNEKSTLDMILKAPSFVRKRVALRNKPLPKKIEGLQLWFDAQDTNGTTPHIQEGYKSQILLDKSPKSNDIDQVTVPSVDFFWFFDCNGKFAPHGGDGATISNIGIEGDAEFTIFFVGCPHRNLDKSSTAALQIGEQTNTKLELFLHDETNGGKIAIDHYQNSVLTTMQYSGSSSAIDTAMLISIKKTTGDIASTLKVKVNGDDVTPAVTPPVVTPNFTNMSLHFENAIGGNNDVTLGEIVVYGRPLNDNEFNAIEKYLIKRWNIK